MVKRPEDFQVRQLALDPSQSFICEAPAGSGKTELLTQRFLRLLALVERPEQVLAITFTRKAAAEMRERILLSLQQGLQPKPESEHRQTTWQLAQGVLQTDQLRKWHLLDNPNRLQIKTFDSLCASLTQSLPLESAFGANPKITDDAEELYRQAVRLLLGSLEDDVPWAQALTVLLSQMDNQYGRLEELLIHMLARREEWLPLMGYQQQQGAVREVLESHLQRIIADGVARAKQLIPLGQQKELVQLVAFAAANLRQLNRRSPILNCLDLDLTHSRLPGDQPEDLPKWQGIVAMLTTFKGSWRAAVDKRFGFPIGENQAEKSAFAQRKAQLLNLIHHFQEVPGLSEALADIRVLPGHHYDDEQWLLLQALADLLPVLSAQLLVVFQKHNGVDFAEVSIRARQALGELDNPSQLALVLDYRIQHILVDEFQDTSANQVELLNQLTAGWEPDDGRSVFCVGDAMQSIYGFRGANVGLFLNCREQGLANVALRPIQLTTNFRSQAGVVEWVNKIFASAFPAQSEVTSGAVQYSPSIAFKEKQKGRAVWVHGFVDRKDNYDEARTVLGIVRKSKMDNPDASIAILVRNRSHAAHIVPLLQEAGIKFRGVDLEPLQDHVVIQDLLSLTRALLHPGDRTAWLSLLRAPWCGLSLVDLEAVANHQQENRFLPIFEQLKRALEFSNQPVQPQQLGLEGETPQPSQNDFFLTAFATHEDASGQGLSPDGLQRLERILNTLILAQENRDRKTLRSWIEGVWTALGGPACVEDAAALKNAHMFFELLENWSYSTSLPSIKTLEKRVQQLFAAPDPEADDRLQIMTIHKSKGLEFDVVIVPALHRTPRREDSGLLMWQERLNAEGHVDLVMAPMTAIGRSKHPTYVHMQSEQSKKSRLEACRLLYVACTRARSQLHLLAHVKQDAANTLRLKHPPKTSLLNTIWQPVQNRIRRNEPKVTSTENAPSLPPVRLLHRLTKQWQPPETPSGHDLDPYVAKFEYQENLNEVDLAWQSNESRHIGTVIHRFLQQIGEEGIDQWSAEKVDQSHNKIIVLLKQLGVPKYLLSDAVNQVALALKNTLADKRGQWVLSSQHSFSANEMPLSLVHRGEAMDLQLDRVFVTDSGDTWVVDYKTSAPESEEDLQGFYQREQQAYLKQLRWYKKALAQAGYSRIRAALYFPVFGGWREISFESQQMLIN